MSDSLIEAVKAARKAAISVLPPREDGSKRPVGSSWEQYQSRRATNDELRLWYTGEKAFSGIGWVCGKVSGNLEVLDFDDRSTFESFKLAAVFVGIGGLLDRIQAGYRTDSPNGVHLPYRCEEIGGNTKLANRPATPEELEENPGKKIYTLIETRGEGGYIIEAPTNGKVNPDGAYVLVSGSVETIVTITPDERRQLFDLARSFDQMPVEVDGKKAGFEFPQATNTERLLPGTDFNQRANWDDILTATGWTKAGTLPDGLEYWRKPGKRRPGWSATVNYAGSDLFYVFTTSTSFTSGRAYSKFGAYAVLNHQGDFRAAAKELGEKGYGDPPETLKASRSAIDLGPPAEFPIDALPDVMADLVRDGAAALNCPPDYIAVPLLVAAGAAIGNAGELQIKSSWIEGANVYASVVGDPGSKKTPAQSLALWPLRAIQHELAKEYERAVILYKKEKKHWESAKRGERGPEPEPPSFQHVLTTDATVEALAVILGDKANKGLLVHHDEMVGWVRSMDQYRKGKGGDRQHYLSMWSREMIKVDRKTAGSAPVIVAKPCVAVVGGIQPDMLADLADAAKREDGFIDRLLWSWPNAPQTDTWTEDEVSADVLSAAARLFEHLHHLIVDETLLQMTVDARALWAQWYDSHAAEQRAERFPSILRGTWAKMPSQLARVAVILHLSSMEQPDNWMRPETLGNAILIIEYFKSHAQRVYEHLSQQRRGNDLKLLAGLRQHGEMNTTSITNQVFAGHITGAELRRLLDDLEAAGLVGNRVANDTNGRAATMWRAL